MKNKGITLIALVITIIILLILAGITIGTLTNSGLFNKTKIAKEKYTFESAKEQLELDIEEFVMQRYLNGENNSTLSELKTYLENPKFNGEYEVELSYEPLAATNTSTVPVYAKVTHVPTKFVFYVDGKLVVVGGGAEVANQTNQSNQVNQSNQENINNVPVEDVPDPNSIENLKEGDYVIYRDGTGVDRECIVLYNNNNYGIQIITTSGFGSITLGNGTNAYKYGDTMDNSVCNCFLTAKNAYNNLIETLDNEAKKYINNELSDMARSVGDPLNNTLNDSYTCDISSELNSSYYVEEFEGFKSSTGSGDIIKLRNLQKLPLKDNSNYWFAVRTVFPPTEVEGNMTCSVSVTMYDSQYGSDTNIPICNAEENGEFPGELYMGSSPNMTAKVRPVFNLKSQVKIKGGEGTAANPYTIGL